MRENSFFIHHEKLEMKRKSDFDTTKRQTLPIVECFVSWVRIFFFSHCFNKRNSEILMELSGKTLFMKISRGFEMEK